jgi:hypothetical protein
MCVFIVIKVTNKMEMFKEKDLCCFHILGMQLDGLERGRVSAKHHWDSHLLFWATQNGEMRVQQVSKFMYRLLFFFILVIIAGGGFN